MGSQFTSLAFLTRTLQTAKSSICLQRRVARQCFRRTPDDYEEVYLRAYRSVRRLVEVFELSGIHNRADRIPHLASGIFQANAKLGGGITRAESHFRQPAKLLHRKSATSVLNDGFREGRQEINSH